MGDKEEYTAIAKRMELEFPILVHQVMQMYVVKSMNPLTWSLNL